MRSSILHLLSLFLILSFAAACGKKNSSGGSSGNSSNQFNAGNTTVATGSVALNNLKVWYQSTAEGSHPVSNLAAITVITKSKSINSNCTDLGLFGDICLNTSGGWTQNNPIFATKTVGAKSSVLGLKSALAPLFPDLGQENPDSLYLHNGVDSVTQAPSQTTGGSIFTITYRNNAGKLIFYKIDSGYNSVVNPIHVFDGIRNTEKLMLMTY